VRALPLIAPHLGSVPCATRLIAGHAITETYRPPLEGT